MFDQRVFSLRKTPRKEWNSRVSWALRSSLAVIGLLLIWASVAVGPAVGQEPRQYAASNATSQDDLWVVDYQGNEIGYRGLISALTRAMASVAQSSKTAVEEPPTAALPERKASDALQGRVSFLEGSENPLHQPPSPGSESNGKTLSHPATVEKEEPSPVSGEGGRTQGEDSKADAVTPRQEPSLEGSSQERTLAQGETADGTSGQGNPVAANEAAPTSFPPQAELESGMLVALNQRRMEAGLPPVVMDSALTWVARQRSNDMATNNYFSHTAPDGTTYITLLGTQGIASGTVGEILGRNNASDELSVAMVMEAFMNSPSHRLHVVYPIYQWVGIGAAKAGDNMKYFTIIFRAPPTGS